MRVLITGAGGMLGLDVQAAAAHAGHELTAMSRAELDITDSAAVSEAVRQARPEVLINCAAYTQVDAAEKHPRDAALVNALGPCLLAKAAADNGAWIVHVSTDYVFDGTKTSGPYVESDLTGPQQVYGRTKLGGEWFLGRVAPHSHTIVRSSWLFGTGGPCFPATILRAAASRPELKVVSDQVGSPTYTPHLAAALLDLAERRDVVGVAHVPAAGETTWFGFATALMAAAQAHEASAAGDATEWATVHPCTTREYPLPAPRPAFSLLRSERDGVPVLADWHQGLEEYITARLKPNAGAVG